MKLLSFSGAATKLCSHAAYGSRLRDYKPDIIAGLSSGALIIFPYLLGKHEEVKQLSTSITLEDIFDKVPVNEEGNITLKGYIRGITKGSFGTMGITKLIKSSVSKVEYHHLLNNPNCPQIYVGVTNMTKDRFELIHINKVSYEDMLKWMVASSTIPLYCPPIEMKGEYYVDGGLKHHSPANEVLRRYKTDIKELISVYSVPEGDNSYPDYGFNGKFLGRYISKTFDVMQSGSSYTDQRVEKELSELYGISIKQYFAESVMKGVWDVNKERLLKLYNSSYNNF